MKKINKFRRAFAAAFAFASLISYADILTQNGTIFAKTTNTYEIVRGASTKELNEITDNILSFYNNSYVPRYNSPEFYMGMGYSGGRCDEYLRKLDKDKLANLSDLWIEAGENGGLNTCAFAHSKLQNSFRQNGILCFELSFKDHTTSVVLMEDGSLKTVDFDCDDEVSNRFFKKITPLKDYLETNFKKDGTWFDNYNSPRYNFMFPIVNTSYAKSNSGRICGASITIYLRYILQKFKEIDTKSELSKKLESEILNLEKSWCPFCWPYIIVGNVDTIYNKARTIEELWTPIVLFPDYKESLAQKKLQASLNNDENVPDYDELIEELPMLHRKSVDEIYDLISNFEKYEGKSYSMYMCSTPYLSDFDNKKIFGYIDGKMCYKPKYDLYSAKILYDYAKGLQNTYQSYGSYAVVSQFDRWIKVVRASKFGKGFCCIKPDCLDYPAYLLTKPFSSFSDESLQPKKDENEMTFSQHYNSMQAARAIMTPIYIHPRDVKNKEQIDIKNMSISQYNDFLSKQLNYIINESKKYPQPKTPVSCVPTKDQYRKVLDNLNMNNQALI